MSARSLPPFVFHMIDEANWESVAVRGLLSASRLIDAFADSTQRATMKSTFRSSTVVLPGGCRLLDQQPMPPSCLVRCLDQPLQPADWYVAVNDRVYFWTSFRRLQRHRAACLDRAQVILFVDTQKLLAKHSDEAEVTPFNSGNARRLAAKRGHRTFVPYATWLDSAWRHEMRPDSPVRPANHRPVELVVRDRVADIVAATSHVAHLPAGQPLPDGSLGHEHRYGVSRCG